MTDRAADLMEDAVPFLTRLRQKYPYVLALLSTKQAKVLSKSPTEPYQHKNVNEEYLSDIACYYSVMKTIENAKVVLSNALLTPRAKDKELDVEGSQMKQRIMDEIAERMKLVIDSKISATEEKLGELYLPRITRLCRKFKFNEMESEIAIYALVMQSCRDDPIRKDEFGLDPLRLCQFLNISLKVMLEFLDKDRTHIEQGFFPDIEVNYLLNSNIIYDVDFYKALMGLHLKTQEFLKIEQTQLADVIAEEPGNEHYRNKDVTSKLMLSDKQEQGVADLELGIEGVSIPIPAPDEVPGPGAKISGNDPGDLDTILRLEREKEKFHKKLADDEGEGHGEDDEGEREDTYEAEDDPDQLKPYKTDLEYLDDHFQLAILKIKVKAVDIRLEMENQYEHGLNQTLRFQRQKREAITKAKVQGNKCKKRLTLTRSSGSWIPRLERMVQSRKLCEFEKNVLLFLIGRVIQPTMFNSYELCNGGGLANVGGIANVGDLLRSFCSGLEEQIQHRKYFYKSASLICEGMVLVHSVGLTGDPSSAIVEVDRRLLDFCVGLDTEFSEIVEGSHLYYPKTKFDQVVLPKEQKSLILNTVSNFDAYKRCRKKMGLDDTITYGAGMVILFHGIPGTGKTMMANALANKLNKKVLLINFPSLGSMSAGENFKFIFRESKINNAILFFDECEAIFESRESGGHQVNLLLTEIERHDGLIILATNRPFDLDEAMHRRIMVAIEFRLPDHLLRKAIWKSHMPEQMTLADDIDLNDLALRFELTGGFIKNSILSALSIAVSRDGDDPVVGQKDLLLGANMQLRGRLRMKDFDRRVVPNAGLEEVIVEESVMKQLQHIVQFEKARAVLFGQWGFSKRNHQGLTILLHGMPGTGKTLVAEAIGYEVGKPLKMVNCGELLSKWVGDSSKNIDAIFQEARQQDAILVFDEAEGLFGERTGNMTSTDRYANVDVGVLLYHIERFPGIIVLTTNLIENIDKAFFRRLRYVLQLNIPNHKLRVKLWKMIIPEETPLADDVNFEVLARHEINGGNIKSVVFRAAARAALRDEDERCITMQDLEDAMDKERSSTRIAFRRQDSDATSMYN